MLTNFNLFLQSRFRTGFALMICLCLTMSAFCATAYATGTGWIEVNATVPEDFNSYLILSVMHDETQEEFDLAILPDNDFFAHEEIPLGNYSISAAWVFQDYRYTVDADVDSFVVDADAAASVHLNVVLPSEPDSEIDSEPIQDDIPVEEPDITDPSEEIISKEEETEGSPSDPMDSEPSEENQEMSIASRIGIAIFGTIVFIGIVFLVSSIARRYLHHSFIVVLFSASPFV